MSKFHSFTIKEVKKETENAISIVFDIPTALKPTFNFIGGQYITIRTTIDEKEIRRSYSICSTPESNELRVVVKEVKNGLFSNYASKKLKKGDILDVAPPQGKFVLQTATSHQRNYAAFAAGSGITPVISMIKSVLLKELHSTFVLVYGNKTIDETIFKLEIDELQKRFPKRFFVKYIFSKKLHKDSILGRIDRSIVNLMIKQTFKNIVFDSFYLCGPGKMIDVVTSTLKENGVAASSIHYELFTSVYTSGDTTSNKLEGNTEITIILDDEETSFEMPQKKLILTAALDEGLDAPFSCQGGICSSCLAKITEGSAIMDKNTILSDAEVNDGFILTCQAHPTSHKITIDYDDV